MRTLIAVPFALVLAVIVAAHFHYHGLFLEKKVTPSDILGTFTTTFLAILLQYVWVRTAKRSDVEKALVQDQVAAACTAVRNIHPVVRKSLDQQPVPADVSKELIAAFQDCEYSMATLEALFEAGTFKKLLASVQEISGIVLRYKILITGNNFPNSLIGSFEMSQSANYQGQIIRKLQLLLLQVNKRF